MPARLPRNLKKIRGTLRKHRDNPRAPQVEAGAPPPPPGRMPATEKAIWREIAVQVEELGTYSRSNVTAFRLLVRLVTSALYPPRDMPETARARVVQAAAQLLRDFGLTPASREKVPVSSPKDAAKARAASFLFGGTPLIGPGCGEPPRVRP